MFFVCYFKTFSVNPQSKYAKYLLQFPQVKQISVRLNRNRYIDELHRNFDANAQEGRKSARLLNMRAKAQQTMAELVKKPQTNSATRRTLRQSICSNEGRAPTAAKASAAKKISVRRSSAVNPPAEQSVRHRIRSQSVCFDERRAPVAAKAPATKKTSVHHSSANPPAEKSANRRIRSQSVCFDGRQVSEEEKTTAATLIVPPKSSFKSAHRRNRRSVSFDERRYDDSTVPLNVPVDLPLDLTTSANGRNQKTLSQIPSMYSLQVSVNDEDVEPPVSCSNQVSANVEISVQSDRNASQVADNSGQIPTGENSNSFGLSSGDILAYENRIESLVNANKAKIMRIKQLVEERDGFLHEIETTHRINHSLAETVDMYRENQDPSNEEIMGEIERLRNRIVNLNRQIFELKEENKRFKSCLDSHSKKVLGEHNYNM